MILLIDLSDINNLLQTHPYLFNLVSSFVGYGIAKHGERFWRNIKLKLEYHSVFGQLDEAYLSIQRIPYRSEFRRKTILVWHNIVIKYQKQFCLDIIAMLNDGQGNFGERSAKLAQEMLNNFTIELQNALPPKVERYYSSFAYLGRDQIRDVVLHYSHMKGLTNKEKAEKYLSNISFFANYIYQIATFQNDLNGELKNIPYTDLFGNVIFDIPKQLENENNRLTS